MMEISGLIGTHNFFFSSFTLLIYPEGVVKLMLKRGNPTFNYQIHRPRDLGHGGVTYQFAAEGDNGGA